MQNDWASENLQVIRTLMERSAVYRRALAPVMGLVGATGITAGAGGAALNFTTSRQFAVYWAAVALVCLAGALLLIRRQALKDAEPFWSPPMRRIAQAVLPAFFVGLVMWMVAFTLNEGEGVVLLLVSIWMLLYGLAMHAAGFFMPRGFRLFGWGFIACGAIVLGCLLCDVTFLGAVPFWNASLAMGGFFGGGHLAYGLYLHFTKKSGNVA